MAKAKLEINKAEFQKIVTELEAAQTFSSPSHLWKAVENTEWAKGQKPRPLTSSVALMRAKDLGIVFVTLPGKIRGNPNLGGTGRGVRVPRSQKMKAFSESFQIMRKEVPVQFHKLVTKAEQGNMRAALKLKCLDCSAWDAAEVRKCECTGCSLYPFRTGANKKVVADVSENEDDSGEES